MADLNSLKLEINTLQNKFHVDHNRFRVLTANLDEMTCCFIDKNGRRYQICANIDKSSYPKTPALWYAETEEASITKAVDLLNNVLGHNISDQVRTLLRELCLAYKLPLPEEINALNSAKAQTSGMDQTKEVAVLEKVRLNLMRDQSGSVQASQRLMKELQNIYKSDAYKNDVYSIELVNDSLYNWKVFIKSFDVDSALHKDLLLLKQKTGNPSSIELRMIFEKTYPFDPPFVHVISPQINGGFVISGGAICMELLTKKGWSSAYVVEAVIMQIASTIASGGARINFNAARSSYSLQLAKQSFDSISRLHAASGWKN